MFLMFAYVKPNKYIACFQILKANLKEILKIIRTLMFKQLKNI